MRCHPFGNDMKAGMASVAVVLLEEGVALEEFVSSPVAVWTCFYD